jgi:hypothetical protein
LPSATFQSTLHRPTGPTETNRRFFLRKAFEAAKDEGKSKGIRKAGEFLVQDREELAGAECSQYVIGSGNGTVGFGLLLPRSRRDRLQPEVVRRPMKPTR